MSVKQKLNFSSGALFHMKSRVCLKYFVNDCRSQAERANWIMVWVLPWCNSSIADRIVLGITMVRLTKNSFFWKHSFRIALISIMVSSKTLSSKAKLVMIIMIIITIIIMIEINNNNINNNGKNKSFYNKNKNNNN